MNNKGTVMKIPIIKYTAVFLVSFFTLTGLKAQETPTEKISARDSIIQSFQNKQIDTTYIFEWDKDSNQWKVYGRKLHFYKTKHQVVAQYEQRWNNNSKKWENKKRVLKSYNDQGEVIENLRQQWKEALEDWMNVELKTITYDSKGNKSEILYQEWKKAVGKWFSTVRYLIEYNRKGEKSNILIKIFKPGIGKWFDHQKYSFYYYNGFGAPDKAIVDSWDQEEKRWEKRGRYLMRHNFRSQKTQETRATWNPGLNKWINGVQYNFEYSKKNKTGEILKYWDYNEKIWNNATKKEFIYNEKDELSEKLFYRWNSSKNEWVLKQRLHFSKEKPQIPE